MANRKKTTKPAQSRKPEMQMLFHSFAVVTSIGDVLWPDGKLDGQNWDSGTVDQIARVMHAAGFTPRGLKKYRAAEKVITAMLMKLVFHTLTPQQQRALTKARRS